MNGLRIRWKSLNKGGTAEQKNEKNNTTPLWSYYQPILKALAALGGEARWGDLAPEVERLMAAELKAGDRDIMANKRQRWQDQ